MTGHPKPLEPREKVRLERFHRWLLYSVTFLVWISGAFWVLLKHPWEVPTDSSYDSPWPPLWMKIHGAAAMAILLLLGSLWVHIRRGLALKRNRVSGLSLLSVALFLTITGWMLYYLGDEKLRNFFSFTHWILGLALPLILVTHILIGRKVFKIKWRGR